MIKFLGFGVYGFGLAQVSGFTAQTHALVVCVPAPGFRVDAFIPVRVHVPYWYILLSAVDSCIGFLWSRLVCTICVSGP